MNLPRPVLRSTATRSTLELDAALVDGQLVRTMDGASTVSLTLHDPHRELLRTPMLTRGPGLLGYIDMQLDDIWWRLVKLEKQGDDITLTFEDRAVAYLRRHNTPKKVTRGKMTRAEFAHSLVAEVRDGGGIAWYSPDEHTVQPIATKHQRKKKDKRVKGIPLDRSDLKIKGAAATPMQLRLVDRVLDVAYSLKAPRKAMVALLEACTVETSFTDYSGSPFDPGSTSAGILQVKAGTAAGLGISNRDPEACANAFLTKGFFGDPKLGSGGAIDKVRKFPNETAGRIAQSIQGSAYPDRYDKWQSEAEDMLNVYDPGLLDVSVTAKAPTKQVAEPFFYRRGEVTGDSGQVTPENSWDALVRLAGDVDWRCFCDRNTIFFVADETLRAAQPVLIVKEDMAAVTDVDFDVDQGKENLSATVVVRGGRWVSGPGMVVELAGCGPADGRWLIASIRHPLDDPRTEIMLTAPNQAVLEPAPEFKTVQVANPIAALGAGGSEPIDKVLGTETQFPVGTALVQPIPNGPYHLDSKGHRLQGVHPTGGLDGYPAIDFGASAGAPVVAMESGTIIDLSGHDPREGLFGTQKAFGWSVYLRGKSGSTYFITHLGTRTVVRGQDVQAGHKLGTVGDFVKASLGSTPNHVHVGVKPAASGHPNITDLDNAPRAAQPGTR